MYRPPTVPLAPGLALPISPSSSPFSPPAISSPAGSTPTVLDASSSASPPQAAWSPRPPSVEPGRVHAHVGLSGAVCPFTLSEGKFRRENYPELVPWLGTTYAGDASLQVDYALKSFTRYRLTLPFSVDAAGTRRIAPEHVGWIGVPLCIRVVFADGGGPLPEGKGLLSYPAFASRKGVPVPQTTVSIGPAGWSDERFGFASLAAKNRGRPLRLLVFPVASPGVVASLVLRITSHARDGEPAAARKRRKGEEAAAASTGSEGSDGEGPQGVSPVALFVPVDVPPEPKGEDLVEAFSKLNPYREGAEGRPDSASPSLSDVPPIAAGPLLDTPLPSDPDAKAVAASFIREVVLEEPAVKGSAAQPWAQPPAADAGVALDLHARLEPPGAALPPFRHATSDAREAAAALVAASHAAVRATAAAGSLRHPVPFDARVPPTVVRACEDLATALSSWQVFDTPLFQTREGRYRTRRMLEDLRLSGSSALVDRVCAAWTQWLFTDLPNPPGTLAEAEAMAGNLWNALEVVAGHAVLVVLDLLPVPLAFVFEAVQRAETLVAPHREAAPLLHAHALRKKGWAFCNLENSETGIGFYFDAWSTLIRSGNSPSRAEALIMGELAHQLLSIPDKRELASHICSRLYWFAEAEDDKPLEALVTGTLAREAIMKSHWSAAKRLLVRACTLLIGMEESYRMIAERLYGALTHCCLRTGDLTGVLKNIAMCVRLANELYCFSSHDMDNFSGLKRYFRHLVSAEPAGANAAASPAQYVLDHRKLIKFLTWFLAFHGGFTYRRSPMQPVIIGHMYYHLGCAHMAGEDWRKALAAFETAQAGLYARFPAYFPPHSARVMAAASAVDSCRRRLAAAAAAPGRPLPAAGPPFKGGREDWPQAPESPLVPSPPWPPLSGKAAGIETPAFR